MSIFRESWLANDRHLLQNNYVALHIELLDDVDSQAKIKMKF
jgi:hypothetical protein